ncbi:unnamed protein product, partial [Porites evermanni]
ICQSGLSYFSGYCYFTSRTCGSWITAVSNCSAMSSNLVTVHNQDENVYIQHRHNGERSWIGLNDRSVEGSFVWTNKEISSFRFWAPRQPNNWRNEDCVHTLGAKHGYTWNDVPCHNCYNYTCFKDLNECTTGSHSCDVNSVCQNTVGSYTCSCNAGYTGDGKPCNVTLNYHQADAKSLLLNATFTTFFQTSTSVLPTLITVTSMRRATILWDRTHACVKQDTQEMEEHAMIWTSVLAVLMTVTVHLLLVPTQWDPLVVRVIILPAEMAELAIYLQVT